MKNTKKKVFVVALVVCLLATISMGTLAWFSAQDSVENKFYVADSTDTTPEDIFSIDVYENYDSDEDGTDEEYQSGITYTDILPGDELQKEAYVKNTGYYDQYVRVIVTISDATAWINAMGLDFAIEDVFADFDATKWNNISKDIAGSTDTITYVLYYNAILDGSDDNSEGETITLFTGINIPESLTQENVAAFGGNFTIDVKAQAVQTENVGADAYAAFQTVGMDINA